MLRILVTILLIGTTVSATVRERFEIGAELLYWKPSLGSPLVARELSEGLIDVTTIDPDFDYGFRLDFGYQAGYFFGLLRYLWLETLTTADTTRTGNTFLDIPPLAFDMWDNSRSHLRVHYQNVDLRGGQFIHCGERWLSYVFANYRWANIVRRLRTTASNNDSSARYVMKSELDGSGLGVGIGTHFILWKWVSVETHANVMGFVADRKFSTWRVTDPDGRVSLLNVRPVTSLVPALDCRLGLHGYYEFRGFTITTEIGYEVNQYWNALKFALPAMASVANSKIVCRDATIAGLYFKLSGMY